MRDPMEDAAVVLLVVTLVDGMIPANIEMKLEIVFASRPPTPLR